MDKKTLLAFIAKAHKHTYAAPKDVRLQHKCEVPILEGHKDNEFSEGDFKYTFEMEGDYDYFKGQERILYKGKSVFFQDVMGSLIK